ncbi:oxidoreductase C-terminal domain-containing protein [Corynebacterium belfantii]|uniref:oxidoreductase C-terminal domain-containing protein n=1 Tax=Corynebacterium belfantii TaxID=2014537 RepID=UPI000B07C1C5|nr:oxidoreductase C-terminal domain-containing protein [Corynebacterium belfantii]
MQDAHAAAASIVGDARPQRTASWFWTDCYGHHVEGVGSMTDLDTSVVRPDAEGRPAVVFRVADDGTLRGAASIDDSMAVRAARRIIDRGIVVDPAQLADPSTPVKKLAR